MKYLKLFMIVVGLLATASCRDEGFTFDTCGATEFDVQSNGADSTFARELDFRLSDVPGLAAVLSSLKSVQLDSVSVTVVSVGANNQATTANGTLEIGALDGSSRMLVGDYSNVPVAAGQTANLTISAAAQMFALTALNGTDHAFKVWVSGSLDRAPADLRLSLRLSVSGKVGDGGSARTLTCGTVPAGTPIASAACNPNPCKNGGTCSAGSDNVPVCACPDGTGGLQCESFVVYLPFITK